MAGAPQRPFERIDGRLANTGHWQQDGEPRGHRAAHLGDVAKHAAGKGNAD